jgi:hypothetical protein
VRANSWLVRSFGRSSRVRQWSLGQWRQSSNRPGRLLVFAVLLGLVISPLVAAVPKPPRSSASSGCTSYARDCTNPATSCGSNVSSPLGTNVLYGSTVVGYMVLRYSSTCGTAWSRVDSYSGCYCLSTSPYPWAQRSSPVYADTIDTNQTNDFGSGAGSYSRQLQDCCGGFLVRAGTWVTSAGTLSITSVYTSYY